MLAHDKALVSIVIILVITALVVYFWPVGIDERGSIRIGALLSLSGNAAFFGDGELKAIQLAVEEENERGGIGKKRIELVVEDMGTLNTISAISALRKLVNIDDVDVIIGPTWDMPGVVLVGEEEGVVMISPDNTEGVESGQSLEYFFSAWHPQRAEMETLAEFAEESGYRKIVIMRDENIFSQTVGNGFIESARGRNITILDTFIAITGGMDFRTDLLKIKSLDADAVLFASAGEKPRGPLVKQIKELGLDLVVLGIAATENSDFIDSYGKYAEGSVFYSYPRTNEDNLEFLERFKDRYGSEPTGPAASNAYDATKIIISAYRQGARNADDIKDILNEQKFPSITFGELEFDEKGFVSLESADIIIKTIENGEFVAYGE